MTVETNNRDPRAGLPTYAATCRGADWQSIGVGRHCGATFQYVADDPTIDRETLVALMAEHLTEHTGWHARAVTGDDGYRYLDVWCPRHLNDPACHAAQRETLADQLEAVAREAADLLHPGDALGGPHPGTLTHALLVSARASALAGLAALTRDRAEEARAMHAAGLLTARAARRRVLR